MCDGSDYSQSYEDEEPEENYQNIRNSLFWCINGIEAAGSYATGGVLDSHPLPGICVDDGRPIALPLSEEAARELASKSEMAPFGKSRETLIDVTVRKTLQIGAERLSFKNPAWQGFVDELVQRVTRELGVPEVTQGKSNVRAELYKHLLYEPGAMFKPHKDTEKHPGMFGTLVICLPSKHTGGAVCLQHANDSMQLSTGETSAYSSYYLAWYADVTHEIKPVETGYRWVLTYNLILDSDSRTDPSASRLDSQIQRTTDALSSWSELDDPPEMLIFPLVHQYTPRNIRLLSLKGLDYQRARCLADSCQRHGGFDLFLAQLDRFRKRFNDESTQDVLEDRSYLHHVCSLEGFELSPLEINIDADLLIGDIDYKRVPNVHGGGEYLGNQHDEIYETYSDAVLVIVRADHVYAPLLNPRSPKDVNHVLKRLQTGLNGSHKSTVRKIFDRLCRMILNAEFATGVANDMYLGHVATAAAFADDWTLFEKARKKTLKRWDQSSWYELGELIDLRDSPINADDIFDLIIRSGNFCDSYRSLTRFFDGFRTSGTGRRDPVKEEYWNEWYCNKLIAILNTCTDVKGSACAPIVRAIASDSRTKFTAEQRQKIDEAITDFVVGFVNADEFVLELNIELLVELSNPGDGRKKHLLDLFGIISDSAISAFDFDFLHRYAKTCPPGQADVLIRNFYTHALAHDKDSASRLLRQLAERAFKTPKDTICSILLPQIKQMIPSVRTTDPEVQACIQSLVEAYIIKTIEVEPAKPEDWSRPAEVCDDALTRQCKVCPKLNDFMRDSEAKEMTMVLGAGDRDFHLNYTFRFVDIEKTNCENEFRFTKTMKSWELGHSAWTSRVEWVQQGLQTLPNEALRQALGDKYDMLMALEPVKIDQSKTKTPGEATSSLLRKRALADDTSTKKSERTWKRVRRDREEPNIVTGERSEAEDA